MGGVSSIMVKLTVVQIANIQLDTVGVIAAAIVSIVAFRVVVVAVVVAGGGARAGTGAISVGHG